MTPIPDVFRAIISHMCEGVLFLNSQHVIQICNPAAEKIRKVKAEQIIGRSIYDIHPRRAHPQISELLGNMQAGTLPSSHRIIQAQGSYFENSYTSVQDSQGRFLGTLLISRDITEQRRLSEEINQLKNVLAAKQKGAPLIFNSQTMQKILETIESIAPLESTVLITGESGTGKECIVDLIHKLSPRNKAPLIKVNCGALPVNLIESELFGHVKGAFTGAHTDNKGKFFAASGGTLFLDEIGELPLSAQVKLLRVIQDKIIQPVGGHKETHVDVRIIAATNTDLGKAVNNGSFREDFFYRLNVIAVEIPPLRERQEDIIPLAETFIKHFARKMKKPIPALSDPARDYLLSSPMPGNVRQLKHAIERAVALGCGNTIMPSDLPDDLIKKTGVKLPIYHIERSNLKEAMAGVEREFILQKLASNEGRKIPTAKALGISRKTLWEKMQRYQLNA
ncbi:PAS domain S-box-containing protein [Desulfuromusa kysingii]|uniref:PAS domain S-box-containing protein n=1 Tax=Desulfuromusa kysingii TaxID=37625 RepID=A0A1H4DPM4_9BACT|nr:sigma 54-interacting transcriptional regulator [Desulfuromusa kysingii]SEA74714.1 PAS domain S-box-containing protein [Desulfuromusa kysingii]